LPTPLQGGGAAWSCSLFCSAPRSRVKRNHRNNKRLHLYCVDFSDLAVFDQSGAGEERH
jgi:hypothetical protein